MRSACILALGVCLAAEAAALPLEGVGGRGRGRERSRRYISAHAYYHALRAELARAGGQLEVARQSLRLALVYDPASVDLHLELAEVSLALGEGEPERLIQRAIQLDPGRARGWAAKGDLLLRRDRPRAAERAYQRALRLEPESRDGRRAARTLALLYQRSGRPELARRALSRLQGVDEPEAVLALATLELEEGRIDEGQRLLMRLEARGGPDLWRRVAERWAWLLRFDRAHELYTRSLQAEDERLRASELELRAALHLALLAGDRETALRHFERLRARAGPQARRLATASFLRAGRASWLQDHLSGRAAEGEVDVFVLALETEAGGSAAWLAARAADPAEPLGRVLLAEALLRRGEAEPARRALESLSAVEPAPLLSALGLEGYERLLGVVLRLDPPRAPRLLEQHPSAPRAAVLAARAALERGERAVAASLLAREEVEADPEGLGLLTELELPAERSRRVEALVRRGLQRDPGRAELWRAQARLHLQRADEARARIALGRALVLDPRRSPDDALWRSLGAQGPAPSAPLSPKRGVRP